MKNGNNNFLDMLQHRGAVPIVSQQEMTQQAINQQVAQVFANAQLFDNLYRHWVNWAHAHGWTIGVSEDKRIWIAKNLTTSMTSPRFTTIGDLFDWLNETVSHANH